LAAGAQAARPKNVIQIDRLGGETKRDGRWLVPSRIEVRVGWGRVTLDFTGAVITQPLLQIDAEEREHGHACGRVEHAEQHQPPSRRQRDVLGPVS
jgi:hypothetical protein